MKRVVIVGGGFGGLAVAQKILRLSPGLDVTLIDKKRTSDFLPMLPDCLGRGIEPAALAYTIDDMCRKLKCRSLQDEVVAVDIEKRELRTKGSVLQYDYLVIASGSETNFYGNDTIRRFACILDGAKDAENIITRLKGGGYATYVVGGGGYTGVEVATNLRVFLRKAKRGGRIVIIERAPAILGPLPEWIKGYVADNLSRLKIEVHANSTIERIEERDVHVSGGKVFDNALVIWAAGVKTADFIQNLKVAKNPQGRIEVDDYLRLDERCFIVGDAAYVKDKGSYLRMAVQFAIAQGECAARNIVNSIEGRELCRYKPVDLGYIIPMANNRSRGTVFGMHVSGLLATAFHFVMCIYRSRGWRNRLGIVKGLIT